jgi:Family of unknown function (DUF5989)
MPDPAPYTPGPFERALLRLGTAGELLALLWRGGRWWMLPLVLVLLGAAVLLLFLQSAQYVAPFVYMVL